MVHNDTRIATASWMEPEVVAAKYGFRPGAFWLGRTIDAEVKGIGFSDDRHVLIVGGTRGGKGTTLLINNLCLWPGSAVVIDPKGENATITAERRARGNRVCEGMGQSVHVLDPYGVANVPEELRSTFNPVDWLDPSDPLCTKKAERLATSLVPFKDKSEDYWDNEARQLIGSLLVHIASSDDFQGRRNLLTLRDLVMRGDMDTYEFAKKEAAPDELQSPLAYLWLGMMANEACGGYVRDTGSYFYELCMTAEKQWAGVRSGVKIATDFITNEGMRNSLTRSDFSFSELKTSPRGATVYLSIPQDFIRSDCGWLRMMIDITSTEMKLVSGRPASGYPVLLMLDEFAGLQRMDVLEDSIAQIAGYGIKMVVVVQNLGQLKMIYKDSWETFVSGAGVKIFFANEDHMTREYASKLIGEGEITRQLRTNSSGTSESDTVTNSTSRDRGSSKADTESGGRTRNVSLDWNRGKNRNLRRRGGLSGLFFGDKRTDDYSKNGGWGIGGGLAGEKGWSKSTTQNENFGESEAIAKGHTTQQNSGENEALHKRALVEPHAIGALFGRIDDEEDLRYPGLALVIIAGQPPMPIRKCNYFEDPLFVGKYTPHPDHTFMLYSKEELKRPFSAIGSPGLPYSVIGMLTPPIEHGECCLASFKNGQYELVPCVEVGDFVEPGDVLARYVRNKDHLKNDPPPIISHHSGCVYWSPPLRDGHCFVPPSFPVVLIEVPEEQTMKKAAVLPLKMLKEYERAYGEFLRRSRERQLREVHEEFLGWLVWTVGPAIAASACWLFGWKATSIIFLAVALYMLVLINIPENKNMQENHASTVLFYGLLGGVCGVSIALGWTAIAVILAIFLACGAVAFFVPDKSKDEADSILEAV